VLRARCGVLRAGYTVLGAAYWVLWSATLVVAQDRPFLFTVTTMTADPSKPWVRVDYDVGAGERAFQSDTDRDAVDLITTFGWARKLASGIALGVEGLAEDLEGFWDPNEAEGGARLLVGPSLHVAPAGRSWQFNATGGPAFHPSDTGRTSGALRDLPPTAKRTGYAARVGLTFRLF